MSREITSSFPFYIKKSVLDRGKMQSLVLLRLLRRDSTRDMHTKWKQSLMANSGIYGFSSRARTPTMVFRSRISHATRVALRLWPPVAVKDKRMKEGGIVGVNFDRLNIAVSKWKRGKTPGIQYPAACHFSLLPSAPRRVLSSLLSPPVAVRRLSRRDEIQKIRGTLSPPSKGREKRFEDGSCTFSTEVAPANAPV